MFSAIMLATTVPMIATTTPMVATSTLQLQQQSNETAKRESEKDKDNAKGESSSAAAASSSSNNSTTRSTAPSVASETRSENISEHSSESQPGAAPVSNVGPIRNKVFALDVRAASSVAESQKTRLTNKRIFVRGQQIILDDTGKAPQYTTANFQLQLQEGVDVLLAADSTPTMNDVHVDSSSYQVLVGSREEHAHLREPMQWMLDPGDEGSLVLKARQDFIAIEEGSGIWALHFDADGNSLERLSKGKRAVLPVELLITAASA